MQMAMPPRCREAGARKHGALAEGLDQLLQEVYTILRRDNPVGESERHRDTYFTRPWTAWLLESRYFFDNEV